MKRYWILSVFGCLVLASAAVWLGGLNQDEGWYLYAARLVSEGQTPYRDFFYTQAPVMPIVYSCFAPVWKAFGLLGARVLTVALGLVGILYAALTARRLAGGRIAAALIVFFLLGCNLYHLYYLAIPKTYALASLFVSLGFYLLTWVDDPRRLIRTGAAFLAGVCLAFAAGTRISLGIMLAVVGVGLLLSFRRLRWSFLWFGLGGALALALSFGLFLAQPEARAGLVAAQAYHAARGGFDPVFSVGSVSRLVRWYLPVFVVLGLAVLGRGAGGGRDARSGFGLETLLLWSFLAVFAVQMLAPFPYEDYQVPVMALLAVFAAVRLVGQTQSPAAASPALLLVFGLVYASSFGSPLLEQWMTNGQDRFWSLKKEKCELAQLREVARTIESLDPGGQTLLTQDLYLAIETGRKVPAGLEMGPFSMLSDAAWRELLSSAPCQLAALSGYSFAIDPPRCDRVPVQTQLEYWGLLKKNYELVMKEESFGQNATSLLILKRKSANP